MKTCAEQLPIEIWISIFQHFEIHDLLYAFNNLNRYFNEILSSDHLLLHVQLEKCEQFYRQLAFLSPWPSSILNRIVYLKSSTQGHGKYLSQFLYWHGSQLLRLKSLTIEVNRQELRPNSIEYLSCHPIEYLRLHVYQLKIFFKQFSRHRNSTNVVYIFGQRTSTISIQLCKFSVKFEYFLLN